MSSNLLYRFSSADFEVLLDEAENEESALPSNFLYDEKLLSKLRNLSTCKDLPSPNEDSAGKLAVYNLCIGNEAICIIGNQISRP